jgi:hypothetical protein
MSSKKKFYPTIDKKTLKESKEEAKMKGTTLSKFTEDALNTKLKDDKKNTSWVDQRGPVSQSYFRKDKDE